MKPLILLAIVTVCLSLCESKPQQFFNSGTFSTVRNPVGFPNFNNGLPSNPIPFNLNRQIPAFRPQYRNTGFESVRKVDVINNLDLPRVSAEGPSFSEASSFNTQSPPVFRPRKWIQENDKVRNNFELIQVDEESIPQESFYYYNTQTPAFVSINQNQEFGNVYTPDFTKNLALFYPQEDISESPFSFNSAIPAFQSIIQNQDFENGRNNFEQFQTEDENISEESSSFNSNRPTFGKEHQNKEFVKVSNNFVQPKAGEATFSQDPFTFNFNRPTFGQNNREQGFGKVSNNFQQPEAEEETTSKEPLDFNFNRPTFAQQNQKQEFEKVRKTDLIENLELPRVNGEESSEVPLKEFEYIPPTYLENRDPPYNVILLTLPKDAVDKQAVEPVPVYNKDPQYSKFKPSRVSDFGSELVYLQSRREVEKEKQKKLEGGR